jgi:trimethylamine:corrinoid methyltransferase-like protein
MEKVFSALSLVLSGVDVINGTGEIDTSQMLVLEQIVVDHEIACLCKRFKDGIDVSNTKDYMEDIQAVGPGGHFLAQPSTIKACRSDEFYLPELSDRNTFEQWQFLGSPTMYSNARNRVEEIVAGPQKNPLSDDVLGKLEDIISKANKELPSET